VSLLVGLARPDDWSGGLQTGGLVVFGALVGLFVAAASAARHGGAPADDGT
jgi:hypothetical protein